MGALEDLADIASPGADPERAQGFLSRLQGDRQSAEKQYKQSRESRYAEVERIQGVIDNATRTLMDARKRQANLPMLAFAAGLMGPTKTGGIGESIGNAGQRAIPVAQQQYADDAQHERQMTEMALIGPQARSGIAKDEQAQAARMMESATANERAMQAQAARPGKPIKVADPDSPTGYSIIDSLTGRKMGPAPPEKAKPVIGPHKDSSTGYSYFDPATKEPLFEAPPPASASKGVMTPAQIEKAALDRYKVYFGKNPGDDDPEIAESNLAILRRRIIAEQTTGGVPSPVEGAPPAVAPDAPPLDAAPVAPPMGPDVEIPPAVIPAQGQPPAPVAPQQLRLSPKVDKTQPLREAGVPPLPPVLPWTNLPPNEAAARRKIDFARGETELADILKKAYAAQNQDRDLAELEALNKKITTGTAAEKIQGRLGWFGADYNRFEQITAEMARGKRQPGEGAISDFDAKQFLKMVPSTMIPNATNDAWIKAQRVANRLAQDKAKFMSDYFMLNGTMQNADQQWTRYINDPAGGRIWRQDRRGTPELNPDRKAYKDYFYGGDRKGTSPITGKLGVEEKARGGRVDGPDVIDFRTKR